MNLYGFRGFESHPHRQKIKDLAEFERVHFSGEIPFGANAVQMGASLFCFDPLLRLPVAVNLLHGFGGALIIAIHQMAVGIERDLGSRMA